jgi:hypothetical protein
MEAKEMKRYLVYVIVLRARGMLEMRQVDVSQHHMLRRVMVGSFLWSWS